MADQIVLKQTHKLCRANRKPLDSFGCGWCFYCRQKVNADQVSFYTPDDSVQCPHCGVDSVLPGNWHPHFIQQMHDYWFRTERNAQREAIHRG